MRLARHLLFEAGMTGNADKAYAAKNVAKHSIRDAESEGFARPFICGRDDARSGKEIEE